MKKVLKKWGLNMKDYFTNNEIDDLLFTSYLIERNTELVDEWGDRGNLTKEEAKYLRTAVTYTKKYLTNVMERMPSKQVEKFALRTIRAIHEPIRIVDKWTYDRIFGKMETEFEVVKMPRNEFDYLAKQLIARCCVQCNQSFKDCDLYTLLDNNMFPTCNLGKNCPYKFIPEKDRVKKEKDKTKISKRKQKKLKNKYDEDEEIYEYNTK